MCVTLLLTYHCFAHNKCYNFKTALTWIFYSLCWPLGKCSSSAAILHSILWHGYINIKSNKNFNHYYWNVYIWMLKLLGRNIYYWELTVTYIYTYRNFYNRFFVFSKKEDWGKKLCSAIQFLSQRHLTAVKNIL